MDRELTEFQLYRNTPLNDFQNTIHFKSNEERDNFFMNQMIDEYGTIDFSQNFNYVKDRSSVNIPFPYDFISGVNYCMFKKDGDSTRYYAHVDNYQYINERVTKVNLLIDPVMTYLQGNRLIAIQPVEMIRESLGKYEYSRRLNELKNNDDVLKTHSKTYFHEDDVIFKEYVVLLESAVDLSSEFGTENSPKIKSSKGGLADYITSPLSLYYINTLDFSKFMNYMSDYPWIVQNIKKATMIPKVFVSTEVYDNEVSVNKKSANKSLKLYNIGGFSSSSNIVDTRDMFTSVLNKLPEELYDMFGLDEEQEAHLLRSEYSTVELYTYAGDSLLLDAGKLSRALGLTFDVNMIYGFTNEMRLFPKDYNVGEYSNSEISGGDLNNSIGIKGFDEVPMTIDNYKLSMAGSANQRQLNEDRLITGRAKRLVSPETSWVDKTMEAFNLISNVSVSGIGNKITDEYEFYRDQQAEQKDLALSGNSFTNQTYNNSFLIANFKHGIHQKFSKPSSSELKVLKTYYKRFGFDGNHTVKQPSDVMSNTIANYIQFKGSWYINSIDSALMTILKLRLEMGVRLWHNNGTANPMTQDLINNKMK